MSHPAWGVWIETLSVRLRLSLLCHNPHGVCGLKLPLFYFLEINYWSHPAWGVWIETPRPVLLLPARCCHTPHGVCGLKPASISGRLGFFSHTPHGVCGLKHIYHPE